MSTSQRRVILVTGASSGIGRATAVGLAAHGPRLLLVGRTPQHCAEALAAVQAAGAHDAEFLQADFSSLAGVRDLAAQVTQRVDRLDVLVNNAAVVMTRRTTTTDGFETTFAINHLSYFLLTGLLLPLLRAAGTARIVNVSSEIHRRAPLDLDDLNNATRYSTFRVYGQSKTANILWTQELARRLEGSALTANSLHPGAIRSNLGRGNGRILDLVLPVARLFLRTPTKGAETPIYLATAAEVATVSGRYFIKCREAAPAPHAVDPHTARRLWTLSEAMVGWEYA